MKVEIGCVHPKMIQTGCLPPFCQENEERRRWTGSRCSDSERKKWSENQIERRDEMESRGVYQFSYIPSDTPNATYTYKYPSHLLKE